MNTFGIIYAAFAFLLLFVALMPVVRFFGREFERQDLEMRELYEEARRQRERKPAKEAQS